MPSDELFGGADFQKACKAVIAALHRLHLPDEKTHQETATAMFPHQKIRVPLPQFWHHGRENDDLNTRLVAHQTMNT
ncbi:hypothetical protein PpBr36_08897 [Pyricularia pennisetigena]|uniref:hypothetical protein n=1 Tax=Pyricularia pennisetigena TaxID=1578925 RepID=UPI001153C9B2|nr:hypothetical protein PpBr36_08897 [Pyricularia pennisetigena]TLS24697.1 hypothetical protein PpBr36_08897 [Pyricularia pennisetigena]